MVRPYRRSDDRFSPANGDNTLKLATTAFVIATRLDQLQAPNVDVPWNSHRITGLLDQ
jgi:hypothetical protein